MSFRPPVRNDLRELPGYHSPQLDVDVRLNTNESPEAPPPAFRQAVVDRVAALDWNRYPDRTALELRTRLAHHHGVRPDNIFVANGSNEVLQTLLLTWGVLQAWMTEKGIDLTWIGMISLVQIRSLLIVLIDGALS